MNEDKRERQAGQPGREAGKQAAIELPDQVEWLLEQLREEGYEAYAVGGCVRDTLLNRRPEDWDITTSARPEQVKAVFGKTVDTGLQHGTVTVIRGGIGYEITTYRIDGEYEDGRHPREVAFTSSLKEDLLRRDFTINAMAYSHETGIVDLFGGMEDLKGRVIRCVGRAADRFTEDALRILRAIRFAAQLDFSIEKETYAALAAIAPNLARVSRERIQTELTKTLLSSCPEKIMEVERTGMSPYTAETFPEIFSLAEEKGTDLLGRLLRSASLPGEKHLRWGAFLAHLGEQKAAALLKELRLDNETIRRVRTLAAWAERPLPGEEKDLRLLMSQMDDRLFDSLLLLRPVVCPEALGETKRAASMAEAIRQRGDCIRMRDLAVTGNDLIRAGMEPGKGLGETLDRLFRNVLEDPGRNRRELLLKLAAGEVRT